jgi:RimJ/RimL family protein N-acetyltransferase
MNSYKALSQQIFTSGDYKLVPIRFEDRFDIMKWRNDQMYHLRQAQLLTKQDQDNYFKTVVASLFDQEKPTQILFSYLENDVCIGYGGLVHINWIDKNAEISFIMDTALEQDNFNANWTIFLSLIEKVAFQILKFHKIFTYAFDLRPHLYTTLQNVNFIEEARLKELCFFDGSYIDVVIHSKINRTC